jgi:hypothetical protein
MLAGIMEAIKQNHSNLQESVSGVKTDLGNVSADLSGVKSDLTENNERSLQFQESVKTDIGNVSADLSSVKADTTSVKADISAKFSQLQDANAKFQENLRAKTKAENEKLIK